MEGWKINLVEPPCYKQWISFPCHATQIESPETKFRSLSRPHRGVLQRESSYISSTPNMVYAFVLLPGNSYPCIRAHLFQYMKKALALGYIHPFTSPEAAGFFFVEKNDGEPSSCIDCWGLNAATVPYRNLQLLVPLAIEHAWGAWIFT